MVATPLPLVIGRHVLPQLKLPRDTFLEEKGFRSLRREGVVVVRASFGFCNSRADNTQIGNDLPVCTAVHFVRNQSGYEAASNCHTAEAIAPCILWSLSSHPTLLSDVSHSLALSNVTNITQCDKRMSVISLLLEARKKYTHCSSHNTRARLTPPDRVGCCRSLAPRSYSCHSTAPQMHR